MPMCMAVGCDNMTGLHKKSFFRIPNPCKFIDDKDRFQSEKGRTDKWLHSLKRGFVTEKFTFGKDKVLCKDYFESSMFKEDMKAKILGCTPNTKILKETAYPTPFDHIAVKKARESSEKRSQVKDKKDVSSSHPFIYFLLNSPGSQLHNVKATTPDSPPTLK